MDKFEKILEWSGLVATFEDFINHNNKIMHKECTEYLIGRHITKFVQEVRWPLLVGKDLFQGDFIKKTLGGINATFRFQAAEEQTDNQKMFAKAVYVLRQNEQNQGLETKWISVGRSSRSDITINDYAISKQHAGFVRKGNLYYVSDLGSTNGVIVNEQKVALHQEVPIKLGQVVHFGRFSFLFVHPVYYYCMVYVQKLSSFPAQQDLWRVAERADYMVLHQIARSNGYRTPIDAKYPRQHLLHYMKKKLTAIELVKWLSQLPLL